MRWYELYEYLTKQRHNNPNFRWNNHICVHNLETEDEFVCDTEIVKDSSGDDRVVLIRLEDNE